LKTFPGATVFLFEPGTAYTREMQATLDSHERLELFPIAIGERDGPVTFHVHPDPHGSTTVDWQEGNFATVEIRRVPRPRPQEAGSYLFENFLTLNLDY
jgi:FkbM family methyltransferase